jgi:hypothetical protein
MKFKVALWLGCGALVTIAIIGSQVSASAQWSKRSWVNLRQPGNIIELVPRRSQRQNMQQSGQCSATFMYPKIADRANGTSR